MKKKFFIFLLFSLFLITGCTKRMTNNNNEKIIYEKTHTAIIDNIICKPIDTDLQKIYKDNSKDIDNIENCSEINVLKWRGWWDTFFIYPIAFLFIHIGLFFNNFAYAIILLAILMKIITHPSNKRIAIQNEKLKEIKPQIKAINLKYKDKTDSVSLIEKSDAIKKIYEENNIKPFSGLFSTLIQLPILFALIEVLYRVPILSESTFLGMNLAIAPINGIKEGNYIYLILSISLVILSLIQSFMNIEKKKITFKVILLNAYITFIVAGFAYSLPSGIMLYFLISYIGNIIQKLIFKHKLSKK